MSLFPYIIFESSGSVASVLMTDEKGFKKSLERGEIWHRDSSTGSLLPYREGGSDVKASSFRRKTGWAEAVLLKEVSSPEERVLSSDVEPAPESKKSFTGEKTDTETGNPAGDVLSALSDVIRKRRELMPEGSYTTHLFSSGSEKIRKKLGEEAIEVILASDREGITYEAADLLYHLMVMLEYESIPVDEVLKELEKRMK